ncbi:amino acid racemase [Candidatus Woesearchaeota archaeon]|jgi:aspartate racemase|nr:amino acid racemase [Candidatus Woesearchaeota archaeon]MBT5272657.1 amino acid racemase [Candidatus Woesearchaeota archaeon]MBT6041706.1 amino acid racemase [Candidatus Woesearchaeota archaeon]MBT6337209.1 amino acid racemase [Candidatus Woesearchaeota archaeon]MBT7928153.1 amino acid racemase [Candidatus Woesearchaeota archaeon]
MNSEIRNQKFKKIGIIGGMGPEATADLYLKIIKLFQEKFNAKYDTDFPEMYIINLPLPDVVEGQDEKSEVKEAMLIEAAKKLKLMGAEIITIQCNTASYYQGKIKKEIDVDVINIVEETSNQVKNLNLNKVGLIATEMTIKTKIYDKFLQGKEIRIPEKEQQQEITRIIMRILSGEKNENDKEFLYKLIEDLQSKGAERVILGCTDLPLLITDDEKTNDKEKKNKINNKKTIDSTMELAKAIVNESR